MRYDGVETSILRNRLRADRKDLTKLETRVKRLQRAISGRRRGYPDDTMNKRAYNRGQA